MGSILVCVYVENSDCQVYMILVDFVIRYIFKVLPSTKTMIHENFSSHDILQIMLPILRSTTWLPCIISYMFWLLSSLTLSSRTKGIIVFLFIIIQTKFTRNSPPRWFRKQTFLLENKEYMIVHISNNNSEKTVNCCFQC